MILLAGHANREPPHALLAVHRQRASENVAATNGFAQRALLRVPACPSKQQGVASDMQHGTRQTTVRTELLMGGARVAVRTYLAKGSSGTSPVS